MMVGQALDSVTEFSSVGSCMRVVFGWEHLGSRFSLVMTICEQSDSFYIPSLCVNLIRVFLCDNALHKLGS